MFIPGFRADVCFYLPSPRVLVIALPYSLNEPTVTARNGKKTAKQMPKVCSILVGYAPVAPTLPSPAVPFVVLASIQ